MHFLFLICNTRKVTLLLTWLCLSLHLICNGDGVSVGVGWYRCNSVLYVFVKLFFLMCLVYIDIISVLWKILFKCVWDTDVYNFVLDLIKWNKYTRNHIKCATLNFLLDLKIIFVPLETGMNTVQTFKIYIFNGLMTW